MSKTELIILILTGLQLIGFSFYAKGKMDISGKDGFKNKWWNKTDPWKNKYFLDGDGVLIQNIDGYYRHWYYFGIIKTQYKERFMFSSTALVFTRDGWHFIQFIFLSLLSLGIALILAPHVSSLLEISFIWSALFSITIIKLLYALYFNISYETN